MLINVYYNPGDDGAELNFGYRGHLVQIDLGFDASEDLPLRDRVGAHGDQVVRGRHANSRTGELGSHLILHLPMQFFVNLWSSRSEEFAGKLAGGLPAHSDTAIDPLAGPRAGLVARNRCSSDILMLPPCQRRDRLVADRERSGSNS